MARPIPAVPFIPAPSRTESGHRRYAPEILSLLRLIRRAQDSGFALREIRELLEGHGRSQALVRSYPQPLERRQSSVGVGLSPISRHRRPSPRTSSAGCSLHPWE